MCATATAGEDAAVLQQLSIPVGERLTGWVAAADQPMVNADPALDLFDTGLEHFRSALSVPATMEAADAPW